MSDIPEETPCAAGRSGVSGRFQDLPSYISWSSAFATRAFAEVSKYSHGHQLSMITNSFSNGVGTRISSLLTVLVRVGKVLAVIAVQMDRESSEENRLATLAIVCGDACGDPGARSWMYWRQFE
ncbi:hypothetical protein OHA72_12590 [Dactylosporangium sp. NBC_01737]|uniref:hypothetical protein n=1 Tax=Dactylosporangium sp. NBC_01737 TaxID=2975959 RepID=UPI002E131C62|nr:hypothetical protein OHA72_12590 [Dactylosporangium sp. NBC_01737]